MNNSTAHNISPKDTSLSFQDNIDQLLSFVPLIIIGVGLVGNCLSFTIFRFHNQFNTMPSMVYLSFVTVTDSLSLLVWNLNHYIYPNFGLKIERLNEPACRISIFNQFVSLESSALLLSMVTIDRYFTVIAIPGSFVSKLPFRTLKSAYIWSTAIVVFVSLLNFHILVVPRVYGTIVANEVVFKNATYNVTVERISYKMQCYNYVTGYEVSPSWEKIHMIIYNLIPFCIMTFFNGLLIKNVLMTSSLSRHLNNKSSVNSSQLKAQRKKRSLTITLVLVTVLFMLMTLPSSLIFGFFADFFKENFGELFLLIVDYFLFANSASMFFISLATNIKFRRVVLEQLRSKKLDPYPEMNRAQRYFTKTQTQTQTQNAFENKIG